VWTVCGHTRLRAVRPDLALDLPATEGAWPAPYTAVLVGGKERGSRRWAAGSKRRRDLPLRPQRQLIAPSAKVFAGAVERSIAGPVTIFVIPAEFCLPRRRPVTRVHGDEAWRQMANSRVPQAIPVTRWRALAPRICLFGTQLNSQSLQTVPALPEFLRRHRPFAQLLMLKSVAGQVSTTVRA
jgi:hypothetical protein